MKLLDSWGQWAILVLTFGCGGDPHDPEAGGAGQTSSGGAPHSGGASSTAGVTSSGAGGTSAAGSNAQGGTGTAVTSGGSPTASGGSPTASGGGSVSSGGCLVGGSAGIALAGAPSLAEPGVWQNVTPDGILTADGVGAQDVIVDPVRPSDLYAFGGAGTGVWKSSDYGSSWSIISTGTLGEVLNDGRQWTAAIDPSPARDPETPPTLYTANGYGSMQGVFKSIDGGVNWQHYVIVEPGANIYSLDIDPCDSQHVLAGRHHTPDIVESTDGGETWTQIPTTGSSIYVWFIDTGDAATTRTTWLAISESDAGGATLRTTDSGKNWTQVSSLVHAHGSSQIFQADGLLYIAGIFGNNGSGVYRSSDFGATFTHLTPDIGQNGVFGTSQFLYTDGGGQSPSFKTAPRDNDTSWTDLSNPAEMTYSTKRAAVTSDGVHTIIVAGNWSAGIWRYVEP